MIVDIEHPWSQQESRDHSSSHIYANVLFLFIRQYINIEFINSHLELTIAPNIHLHI